MRQPSRVRFGKGRVLVAVFFLIALTSPVWLPWPGSFLVVRDRFERADCLVPLQGDSYFRFKKTVELLEQGYANWIVISTTPERAEELRDYYFFHDRVRGLADLPPDEVARLEFQSLGADPKKILFTDFEVTSTYDEAVATRRLMEKRGLRSLILVTSGYHMRRALWVFRAVFRESGIRIDHVTARHPLKDSEHWWRKERDVKEMILEYASIGQNFFYHFLLGRGRTAFDTF